VNYLYSVDGEVRVWDIRTHHGSIMDYRPFSGGLANMALHNQTGNWAVYVLSYTFVDIFSTYYLI